MLPWLEYCIIMHLFLYYGSCWHKCDWICAIFSPKEQFFKNIRTLHIFEEMIENYCKKYFSYLMQLTVQSKSCYNQETWRENCSVRVGQTSSSSEEHWILKCYSDKFWMILAVIKWSRLLGLKNFFGGVGLGSPIVIVFCMTYTVCTHNN